MFLIIWRTEQYGQIRKSEARKMLMHARFGCIDVETDPARLEYGTDEQKVFYKNAWEATYQEVVDSGYFDGYPEEWEFTGHSKKEWDDMHNPANV